MRGKRRSPEPSRGIASAKLLFPRPDLKRPPAGKIGLGLGLTYYFLFDLTHRPNGCTTVIWAQKQSRCYAPTGTPTVRAVFGHKR